MRARRANASGFTLMEVVVATTLTAALMAILFMGLRVGASAWRRGEQKLNERARSVAGMDMLERQVASATPRVLSEVRDRAAVSYVDFRGSANEVRFVTARSWQGDRTYPLYMATYRVVDRKDGGQQLSISETGLTDAASIGAALFRDSRFHFANEQPARAQEIGDPAERIDFFYLQPAVQPMPAQWVSEWAPEQRAELPRGLLVRWQGNGQVRTATFVLPRFQEPQIR